MLRYIAIILLVLWLVGWLGLHILGAVVVWVAVLSFSLALTERPPPRTDPEAAPPAEPVLVAP